MPTETDNLALELRHLAKYLGPEGAKAGLMQSRLWTVTELKRAAESFGIKTSEKATRQQLIEEIVRIASRRIEKRVEELYKMNFEELAAYFEQIEVSPAELLDLLKELDLTPRKEGRRKLIEFASRELSETGRFMTISAKH
jgi:hypothetical protein